MNTSILIDLEPPAILLGSRCIFFILMGSSHNKSLKLEASFGGLFLSLEAGIHSFIKLKIFSESLVCE